MVQDGQRSSAQATRVVVPHRAVRHVQRGSLTQHLVRVVIVGVLALVSSSSSTVEATALPPTKKTTHAHPQAHAADGNVTTWHVVWTGGQSNSVGTNSQKSGYPTWPTTDRIQMFCWSGHCNGTFTPATVPLYGEANVGFSQTFANLLLATLPPGHGVVTLNTGVGGTGFSDGRWTNSGDLTLRSVAVVKHLAEVLPTALGGQMVFHAMLWHQGEEDAGDNRQHFQASYCHYLEDDMGNLVDYLRDHFPGASAGTPFIDGGMLPFWVDAVNGTAGVMSAIYAVNTSRPCTGTANSRIFSDFFPGTHTPNGEPGHRSGITGDVIHFNATQAVLMGHQYFAAYRRAVTVNEVVHSARTDACGTTSRPVSKCTQ